MKIELTRYYKENSNFKLKLPFGNFYLFKKFYVAEINEGVHLSYNKLKIIFQELTNFYGKDAKIVCISNRVNSYSTEPVVFNILDHEFPILKACALISYNEKSHRLAVVEQIIIKNKVFRFTSLPEALYWATNYTEGSKVKNLPSLANNTLSNTDFASRRKSS
ncbi:hypothetical protein [Winogradskyella marincola]|uniref:SpoIIAA-like n=1 Tax=Winogradskyella marincola TaxID=3037795 RepID=A0ABT6G4Y4_9FLAO|nr:hypothetical protein [Winogradskyella sp. YYF002]MDG4717118.1 hypothetical protein [Winogradskyella sp. YYF002]